jgi:hypothetical protein
MPTLNSLKSDLRAAKTSIENIRITGAATPREIGTAMKDLANVVEKLLDHLDEAERAQRGRSIM